MKIIVGSGLFPGGPRENYQRASVIILVARVIEHLASRYQDRTGR